MSICGPSGWRAHRRESGFGSASNQPTHRSAGFSLSLKLAQLHATLHNLSCPQGRITRRSRGATPARQRATEAQNQPNASHAACFCRSEVCRYLDNISKLECPEIEDNTLRLMPASFAFDRLVRRQLCVDAPWIPSSAHAFRKALSAAPLVKCFSLGSPTLPGKRSVTAL